MFGETPLIAVVYACLLKDKLSGVCLCSSDLDKEVAVPSGASARRDCSDRPNWSHVEDGAARYCGISGAVLAEDGEDALKTHTQPDTHVM